MAISGNDLVLFCEVMKHGTDEHVLEWRMRESEKFCEALLSGGGSPPPDKYVTEAEPGQVAYDSGKWYSGKAASQICLNVKDALRGRAEPGEPATVSAKSVTSDTVNTPASAASEGSETGQRGGPPSGRRDGMRRLILKLIRRLKGRRDWYWCETCRSWYPPDSAHAILSGQP
jgi:hypothetical protein